MGSLRQIGPVLGVKLVPVDDLGQRDGSGSWHTTLGSAIPKPKREMVARDSPVARATATESYTVDLNSTLGGGSQAYVGFTGGTGGLSAVQNILTWTFADSP